MKRACCMPAVLVALPSLAWAQANPALQPAISPAGSLFQVVVGLIFVLLLIVATGWLTRRLGIGRAATGQLLHVVGSTPVGTRERVVVVEIDDTWLVVGVAPGSVNALTSLPKGSLPAGMPTAPAHGLKPFKDTLQQMLAQRREK